MTKEEVKDYRTLLEKEYMGKDTEIDSSIVYISAGALGLVLSINDKFITIKTADLKFPLVTSLILLFTAFISIIWRKVKTIKHDIIMLDYLNEIKEGSNTEQDIKLLSLYTKFDNQLKRIRIIAIWSLVFGVALDIFFYYIF